MLCGALREVAHAKQSVDRIRWIIVKWVVWLSYTTHFYLQAVQAFQLSVVIASRSSLSVESGGSAVAKQHDLNASVL